MNKVTKPIEDERPKQTSTIGKKIDYIRRNRDVSQKELAKKLDIDRQTLIRYETGKTQIPIKKLKQISEILNVSTDYLLGLNDTETYNIEDNAINKKIGLSTKTIKILKYDKKLVNIINFLVQQEEMILLGVLPPREVTKFNEEEYKKAEKIYNEEFERITNNCIPLLSTIYNYFLIQAKNEDIYIMADGTTKQLKDFKYKVDRYLANETVNTKDVIENAYLDKIESQLKMAKKKYLKKEEK